MALWTISNKTAYNLVFTAPVSSVESFAPIALNMIDTFEVFLMRERYPDDEPEQREIGGPNIGYRA